MTENLIKNLKSIFDIIPLSWVKPNEQYCVMFDFRCNSNGHITVSDLAGFNMKFTEVMKQSKNNQCLLNGSTFTSIAGNDDGYVGDGKSWTK